MRATMHGDSATIGPPFSLRKVPTSQVMSAAITPHAQKHINTANSFVAIRAYQDTTVSKDGSAPLGQYTSSTEYYCTGPLMKFQPRSIHKFY